MYNIIIYTYFIHNKRIESINLHFTVKKYLNPPISDILNLYYNRCLKSKMLPNSLIVSCTKMYWVSQ